MQTMTFKARADKDGIVRLEIPTNMTDRDIEIVLVMQAVADEPLDDMDYPIGYFEGTYGMFMNDPLERNQLTQPEVRDQVE